MKNRSLVEKSSTWKNVFHEFPFNSRDFPLFGGRLSFDAIELWLHNSAIYCKAKTKCSSSLRFYRHIIDALIGLIVWYALVRFDLFPPNIFAIVSVTLRSLKQLIEWISLYPAGLKLNAALNSALSTFFLYHIYLWQTYLTVLSAWLWPRALAISCVFGFSMFLAAISDLISLLTIHMFCFHVYSTRYIGPKDPKSFNDGNLPDCEEELVEEESKQRSSLDQLHREIEELREMNVSTKEKEEEMWDVQTAITLLNRKLKSLRGRRSESVERSENDGPTLEMFEEKQLLATCTALYEEIARYKADIIALENKLLATSANEEQGSHQSTANGAETILNEVEQSYWRNECEKKRSQKSRTCCADRCRETTMLFIEG